MDELINKEQINEISNEERTLLDQNREYDLGVKLEPQNQMKSDHAAQEDQVQNMKNFLKLNEDLDQKNENNDIKQTRDSQLQKYQFKKTFEYQSISTAQMLKDINEILNKLPNRIKPGTDENILDQHSFSNQDEMDTNILSLLINLPKEKFITQNLTKNIEEFKEIEYPTTNLYFEKQIQLIKDLVTVETETKSQFTVVKERDEIYLILYQIEQRQKKEVYSNNDSDQEILDSNEGEKIELSSNNGQMEKESIDQLQKLKENYEMNQKLIYENQKLNFLSLQELQNEIQYALNTPIIMQCFIFKLKLEFELTHKFLLEINSKCKKPSIFNRVFINADGIYFLEKLQEIENQQTVNYLVVNHQKFEEKGVQGFDDFKNEDKEQIKRSDEFKQILKIKIDDQSLQLEDLDIGFIQNINQDNSNSIQDMFVIVFIEKQLQILSLNGSSQPVIKLKDKQISKLTNVFTIKKDKYVYFIIQQEDLLYEIKWDNQAYLNLDENSSKEYIQQIKDEIYQLEIVSQPIVEKLQINLPEGQYDQYFYINQFANIQLIHPFQTDQELRNSVKNKIKDYHSINSLSVQEHVLRVSNNQNQFLNVDSKTKTFLYDIRSRALEQGSQILLLQNIILIMNQYNTLDVIIFKLEEQNHTVLEFKNNLKKNEYFLFNQIEQFNVLNDLEFAQDNYKYSDEHITNQKVNEMYLVEDKKEVTLGHHMIAIREQQFIFSQNNLIIQLGDDNGRFDIQLLRLHENEQACKQNKLLKYHFSSNYAVFFFSYRYQEGNKLIGVHYYKIVSISQLRELVKQNQSLINESSIVHIMIKEDQIDQTDFNSLYLYSENNKVINGSSNELVFEMTRDLSDPTKDYFPFLFYHRVDRQKFEIFLSFINLELAGDQITQKIALIEQEWKKNYISLDDQQIQRQLRKLQNEINWNEYIESFKVEFYQRVDEPIEFKDCDEKNCGMRQDVLAHHARSQNMFCRTSNWQLVDDKKINQATFQLGFNIQQDELQAVELRKYLVSIPSRKNNSDSNSQTIQVKPVQMQYITFNHDYLNKIIIKPNGNNYKQAIENHRLISLMDDNGNINGSALIFNNKLSQYGVWKITEDIETIKRHHSEQIAKTLVGKFIFVTEKTNETFSGYLFDGILKQDLNIEFLDIQINKNCHVYDIIYLKYDEESKYTIKTGMCSFSQSLNYILKESESKINIIQKNSYIGFTTLQRA